MRLRKRLSANLFASAGLLCVLLLAAGCSGHDPQDTLAPHGHIAAVTKRSWAAISWRSNTVTLHDTPCPRGKAPTTPQWGTELDWPDWRIKTG